MDAIDTDEGDKAANEVADAGGAGAEADEDGGGATATLAGTPSSLGSGRLWSPEAAREAPRPRRPGGNGRAAMLRACA